MDVANDVVAGSSFKESAKKRVPEGIKTFVSSLIWPVWKWQEKETHLVEV